MSGTWKIIRNSVFRIFGGLILLSADNLCKQFASRSEPTERRSWSGSELFYTLIVFLEEFFEKVNFEKSQQMTAKAWKVTQHAKSQPGKNQTGLLSYREQLESTSIPAGINFNSACRVFFFMLCCRLLTFFKIKLFIKFFQENYQSVKQFRSRSGLLIWIQTVSKVYQQMTKVMLCCSLLTFFKINLFCSPTKKLYNWLQPALCIIQLLGHCNNMWYAMTRSLVKVTEIGAGWELGWTVT